MMKRRSRTISTPLLVCLVCLQLLTRLSAETDSVTLTDGTTLRGELQGIQAGFLLLQIPTDSDGRVLRRLVPHEIARIQFSDTSSVSESAAETATQSQSLSRHIAELEKLTRARSSYFGLLQAEDEGLFIDLIDAYIEDDRGLEALAYAKLWQTKLRNAEIKLMLRERLIEAALAADLIDEALVFATDWRRAYPDHPYSALAAHVVADAALQSNHPETAAWITLKPIVQQGNPSPRHLERCYETAIKAIEELGDHAYASRLAHEKNLLFDPTQSSSHHHSSAPTEPDETSQKPSLPSLAADALTFDRILKSR